MQRRTIILIQKSRSRELTLDLIPQLTASLVGFMYLIGGIKPGANSLHVCGGQKWWCVCRWTGISMPRSLCETSPPARQKNWENPQGEGPVGNQFAPKVFCQRIKLPQESRQKELSRGLIPGRWLFPYPMTRGQKNYTMVKWN